MRSRVQSFIHKHQADDKDVGMLSYTAASAFLMNLTEHLKMGSPHLEKDNKISRKERSYFRLQTKRKCRS